MHTLDHQNERWVTEEVTLHYGFRDDCGCYDRLHHRLGGRLRLACYHRATKELLHFYGPFQDTTEVLLWCRENNIQLDDALAWDGCGCKPPQETPLLSPAPGELKQPFWKFWHWRFWK